MNLRSFGLSKKTSSGLSNKTKYEQNPIPYYLMSCYLYYECSASIMEDTEFDHFSKWIFEHWDEIEHPDKHLIDKDGLLGGGSHIKHTNQIKGAALHWYEKEGSGNAILINDEEGRFLNWVQEIGKEANLP